MLCVGVALALFASTRNRRPLDTHRLEEFERRAEAGSGGTVGPNLDQAKPRFALVVQRVTAGKGGMPSFKGQLSPAQIQAVARYVSSSAGH